MRVFRPILLFGLLLASTLSLAVQAKTDPVYTGYFSNLAVSGYDAVAYFTEHKPVKGSARYSYPYLDAEWRFSSAENLAAFKLEPEKFAPQYGGYCAWAISQGDTVKGSPRYWKIVNGKLYLNYDEAVQKTWESDIPGFIKAAEQNWPVILAD